MSKSRAYIETKLKLNSNVYDSAKWHFHNKSSKKIWATLQWLHKNDLLTEVGLETYNLGYKGLNNILRITKEDVVDDGKKVMETCYPQIGDAWNKVDTILSRCYKRL